MGTDPTIKDTDGDGLWDGEEWIELALATLPSVHDTDGDGLSDGTELRVTGTNPNDPDTDGDGIADGVEVENSCLYTQTFNGYADGTTDLGDGSVIVTNDAFAAGVYGEQLELTRDDVNSQKAAFGTPALGLSGEFAVAFDYSIFDAEGGNPPADGFSFNFGPITDAELLDGSEEGYGKGLSVQFDTWNNGGEGADTGIGLDIAVDGTQVASIRDANFHQVDGTQKHVEIIFEEAVVGGGIPYDQEVMGDEPMAYWRFEDGVTGVTEENLGDDTPAEIGANFGEDALTFSDRTHQHNGAAFDDDGNLSTGGANAVPLPGYLVGNPYIMFANNARDQGDYSAVVTATGPSNWYLLIDNRIDGPAGNASSPNTSDPVLGGNLQWVIDGGWQRVKTGISPNDADDYTGVDEGGDGEGAGVGLNQFYSVYTQPAPTASVTVSNNGTGGSNMIALVVAPLAVDTANAKGEPSEVRTVLEAYATYNARVITEGAVDLKDATFMVDIDFDAHPGGNEQCIWESGGGTVGWSVAYADGNKIVVRKAGLGGNTVSTLEYTLTQDQIDGGDVNVSWTFDRNSGAGGQEQFLLINGDIVARDHLEMEADWTGGNGSSFGVATTAMAAGGGNTSLAADDFTAGTINLDNGLRFWEGVASEPTDGTYNGIGFVANGFTPLGTAAVYTGSAGSSNIDFGSFGKNHLAQLSNIDNQEPVPPGDPNAAKKTSVEFWLQTDQTSGSVDNWRSPLLFGEESPGDGDIQWGWITDLGESGFAINDGGGAIIRGPVINDNEWHHIVQTFDWDTGNYQLYLDGKLAQEQVVGANIFHDADGGLIRYMGWNSRVDAGAGANSPHLLGQFTGSLDEVAIYNKILNPAQVNSHFGAGAPRPNRVTVKIGDDVVYDQVDVTGFDPAPGDRIAFVARTGGANETVLIDNLCVRAGTELPDQPMDPLDPNTPGAADPEGLLAGDSDNDGVSDSVELLTGTDRFDASDFFHVSGITSQWTESGLSLMVDLATKPGKTYMLQFSPTLGEGTWENVDIMTADYENSVFEIVNPKAFQRREGYFRAVLVEQN